MNLPRNERHHSKKLNYKVRNLFDQYMKIEALSLVRKMNKNRNTILRLDYKVLMFFVYMRAVLIWTFK